MIWLLNAAWACEEPTSIERVGELLVQAEVAFRAMDLDTFEDAHGALMAELPCLAQPLDAPQVAAIHQLEAMSRFAAGEPSTAAWRSALQAHGALQLDPAMAPEGHPLREELEAARSIPDGEHEALREGLLVDASPGHSRALDRPVLVQDLSLSWYLLESQPTPAELLPPEPETPQRDVLAIGLSAGAAGTAALAGGLYTGAWRSRAVYDDPATPYRDLDGLRTRTNALTTSSAVAGGLAAGLALGAGLAWSF